MIRIANAKLLKNISNTKSSRAIMEPKNYSKLFVITYCFTISPFTFYGNIFPPVIENNSNSQQ
ncbi:MAG: hypothetical protein EBZ58_13040 [Bacteroidetes bacterium]|nr:hypothetical protein [Bacteroidota bacterium]